MTDIMLLGALREVMEEMADDLENRIKAQGGLPRRIERDMKVVERARAMLAAAPAPEADKPQISLELMQAIVDAGFMLIKMGDKYRLEKAVKITALADKPEPPKETT